MAKIINILKYFGLFFVLAVAYYYGNFYKPLDYDYEKTNLYLKFTCFDFVNFIVILILKNENSKICLSKFLFYFFWLIGLFCFFFDLFLHIKFDNYNSYIMPLVMYMYLFEIIFHEKIQSFYPEKLVQFLNNRSYRFINFMFWCLIIYYFLLFIAGLLGIIFPE